MSPGIIIRFDGVCLLYEITMDLHERALESGHGSVSKNNNHFLGGLQTTPRNLACLGGPSFRLAPFSKSGHRSLALPINLMIATNSPSVTHW